jgi:hypothetical protein
MHLDLAAIDARKEILTQVRGKGEREQGKADEPRDQLDAIAQTKLKQAAIAAADRFELTLEALLESQQRVPACATGLGGDQRKHDCFCQRAEEIARHTAEAEHWYESEADAHQRYGSRDNDLLRAVQKLQSRSPCRVQGAS